MKIFFLNVGNLHLVEGTKCGLYRYRSLVLQCTVLSTEGMYYIAATCFFTSRKIPVDVSF
jgi:hypothetical protein